MKEKYPEHQGWLAKGLGHHACASCLAAKLAGLAVEAIIDKNA